MTQIRIAAVVSDYFHLLAASFWVGGLFYLALAVPPVMKAMRQSKYAGRLQESGVFCPASHVMAVSRFSALALLSVGALLVTGLYSSWAQVTVFRAVATPYGIVLLAKLELVVPLLMLAAFNSFWVRPRLALQPNALRMLRKVVTAEAILAVLVLLSVGVLVSLDPARQAASAPRVGQSSDQAFTASVEGANIKMTVDPGQLGSNLVTVFITDRAGRAITNATQVTVGLTFLDRDIGIEVIPALDHGFGVWVAHEANFSVAGKWRATITVVRPDAFDARTAFEFIVPLGPGQTPASITPSPSTGKLLFALELVLIGLLFFGVGAIGLGRGAPGFRLSEVLGTVATLAGLALAMLG